MVHLQSDLNVPAVVAPLNSVALKTMFTNDAHGNGNNTFVINPFSWDSTLTSLTTDGLLWHMLGQPSDNDTAYAALMSRVEPYARSLQNLGATTDGGAPLRVATVTAKATVTQDLAAAALKVMRWNGQSSDQNFTAGLYMDVSLESILNSTPLGNIDVSAAVTSLLAFKPNVIVSFASLEFVKLLQNYELNLDSGYPSNPRPFYFVSPYNAGSQQTLVWIGPDTNAMAEAKRTRVAGINFASAADPTELHKYETRFLAVPNPPSALGRENYYDAMYFAVYSVVGAGAVPTLSGLDVAQGMPRLLSGVTYTMGPADTGNITGALGSGPRSTISLLGTLGPPNFNRGTGSRTGEGSVYCISGGVDAGVASYLYDAIRLTPAADGGAPSFGGPLPCYGGL
jgi:hypothetical protein